MVSHAQVMNMLRRNVDYNDMVGSTNGAGYIGGAKRKVHKKKMHGGYIGGCAHCMDGGCVHCMHMGSGYIGGARKRKTAVRVGGARKPVVHRKRVAGSGYIGGLMSPHAKAALSNYREWMAEHKHMYPDFKHRLMVYHQQHPKHAKGGAVHRRKTVKSARGGYAKGYKKGGMTKKQLVDKILNTRSRISACKDNKKILSGQDHSYPFLLQLEGLYKAEADHLDKLEQDVLRHDERYDRINFD